VTLSLDTLQLLHHLLSQQQISVGADRAEIDAVLKAKDELDATLSEAQSS
jgi:hypothetical protein